MPRFLVKLESGVSTADAQASLMDVSGVEEMTPSRSFNGFIATGQAASKQRIANKPGVEAVYENIQAIPQVADESVREDFLNRVKRAKSEDDVAPLTEMEPTTQDEDNLRADGAGLNLPPLTQDQQYPDDVDPQIDTIGGSREATGAAELQEDGVMGEGTIVVIIDTGVCADQIEESRQLEGKDLTGGGDPWSDYMGHGSMCAGVAAGGPQTKAANPGFAPQAEVFPIKSTLDGAELIQSQDVVADLAESTDKHVVVNNSWGFSQCSGLCDHPVTDSVKNVAQMDNVTQIFAAGNQAKRCGQGCDDGGISGPNSIDSVITVGATGHNGQIEGLMPYSCRGGSEVSCGTMKPEVTAPIFGLVPWGCNSKVVGNGGGTSAACPQIAGAACLLASRGKDTTAQIREAIQSSAKQYKGKGWNGCTGYGNLNVVGADRVTPPILPQNYATKENLAIVGAGAVGTGAVIYGLKSLF